jgi:hypothetical protein
MFIEDQVWPKRCGHMKGKQVIALDEQLKKLRAAVEAKQGSDSGASIKTASAPASLKAKPRVIASVRPSASLSAKTSSWPSTHRNALAVDAIGPHSSVKDCRMRVVHYKAELTAVGIQGSRYLAVTVDAERDKHPRARHF